MAHGFTQTDLMVYVKRTQRDVPWHQFGQDIGPVASTADVRHVFGWDVKVMPLQSILKEGFIVDSDLPNVVVRMDNNTILSNVSESYAVVPYSTMLDVFDELTQDPLGPNIETASTLFGGKRAFVCGKLPRTLSVTDEDIFNLYVVIMSSHDKSLPFQVALTSVRTVCNNTLNYGLSRAREVVQFKHFHGAIVGIKDVGRSLGIIYEEAESMTDVLKQLREIEMPYSDAMQVLSEVFPEAKTYNIDENQIVDKAYRPLLEGPVMRTLALSRVGTGIDVDTAYGVLNAYTEYSDHHRLVTSNSDKKFQDRLYGTGAANKENVFRAICNYAGIKA